MTDAGSILRMSSESTTMTTTPSFTASSTPSTSTSITPSTSVTSTSTSASAVMQEATVSDQLLRPQPTAAVLTPNGKRPRALLDEAPRGEGIIPASAATATLLRGGEPRTAPKRKRPLEPSAEEKAKAIAESRTKIKREVFRRLKKGITLQKLLTKIGVHFTVHHNSKNAVSLTDKELLKRFKRFIDKTEAENIEMLISNLSIYDALEKYKRRKPKLPQSGDPINDVVQLFKTSNKIMVVSGAGISVSCGVPDFRSPGGLYERIKREMGMNDPQAIFDFDLFRSNPAPFYSICKDLFPKESLNPSPSHYFIKLLEEKRKLLRNYTQNIDTLECKAGIKRIMHCHGSFATASCIQCGYRVDCANIRDDVLSNKIPKCVKCNKDKSVMKPDIVFFNEPLSKKFDLSLDKDLDKVDLLVVMGSSLRVQPVSIIPEEVRDANSEVPQVLINRELVGEPDQFDYFLKGECDAIIVEICKRLGWTLPVLPLATAAASSLKQVSSSSTCLSSSVTVVTPASPISRSLSSSSIIVVDSPPTPPLPHDEEIPLASAVTKTNLSPGLHISSHTIDVTSTSPPTSPLSLYSSSSLSAGLIATVVKDENTSLSSPSPSPPTSSSLLTQPTSSSLQQLSVAPFLESSLERTPKRTPTYNWNQADLTLDQSQQVPME